MTEDLKQGSKLGDNELMLRIGRGGMATVWVARERAKDPKDDRLVAVKAMLIELADETEFVTMFLDEVRLVRAIKHPNVVEIYDVGDSDGIMWMSMEWVEGESLHTVIAEAGKRRAIPPELAVKIIADAASGLHAAHELRDLDGSLRGVVHRDVSPHNILIGTNGMVKLVDFGVAKAVGRISEATRAGQLKGKFGYMSPEQALGKAVDRRSDIFSLGIVLFELTTSRRLFRGEHDINSRKAVRAALKALGSGQAPPNDLLSGELAFTPTGKDRITVSGVSSVTGSNLSGLSNITSPSTVGRPSSSFSGLRGDVSQPQPNTLSVGSMVGYAVGALGLLVALFVLLFMRH